MPKVAKVVGIIYIYIERERERLHVRKEKKSEGKILSGPRARLYLIRRNNLQRQEKRGEVRQTSARIINAGVALAAANVSRRVGSATSSNSLLCHPPPFQFLSSFDNCFFFPPARSSTTAEPVLTFCFFFFIFFFCVCARALPWRIHERTSAIWR